MRSLFIILIHTLLVVLTFSCNPAKRLPEGKALLVRQKIRIQGGSELAGISDEDMREVLKQKPNRRVVGMRFHLGVYNLVNPQRQRNAQQRKSERKQHALERKKRKGKELTIKEEKDLLADTLTWRDWLANTVGEAPVAFDSLKADKSAEQLKTLLNRNGYFRANVTYETRYKANGRKVKPITFFIEPGKVYSIDSISFKTNDPGIVRRIDFLEGNSKLRKGDQFTVDKLDSERDNITNYLNNRGYYTFTKDYITYQVDSSFRNNSVVVNLIVNPLMTQLNDSSIVGHRRYFIGDIRVHTDYDPIDKDYEPSDTIYDSGVYYLSRGEFRIRPQLIKYLLLFQKGDLYQRDRVEKTYKKLVDLSVVRSVSIELRESEQNPEVLDCNIFISQNKAKYFSGESGVTHRDGLFGIKGSIVFSNRNMFKGAETGQIRINGAIEAQQPLTLTQGEDLNTGDVTDNLRFNTFEIGPEFTMNFHQLFPFPREWFNKSNEMRSNLSAGFNYQNRPDYERQLYQFRYGLNFIENPEIGSRISVDLWELSTIKIRKSAAFTELLDDLDDTFLSTSYQDHLISLMRVAWNVNTQKPQLQRKYIYNRIATEFAGFGIRALFEQTDRKVDELGSYTIGGIRFAQFIRIEEDFRYYRRFDEKNSIATRFHGGVGFTGANLRVLPFEKSFYGGGANAIRAWRPRTLGPGSWRDSTALVTYSNLGDLLLEASFEYRFDLTETLEGAFFVDAGNIWLMRADDSKPGANFEVNRFVSELAVSGGLGFRFDFEFFLVRLDVGAQLKDPAKVVGERWFWEPKTDYARFVEEVTGNPSYRYRPEIGVNFGIGYPF